MLIRSFGDSFGDGQGYVEIARGSVGTNPQGVAVQVDGRIVVVGIKNEDFWVARYLPDGRPDLSFGDGGEVTTDFGRNEKAYGVGIYPNGKILVVGVRGDGGSREFAVLRLTAIGLLDPSFGDLDGSSANFGVSAVPYEMVVEPDGRILLVGCRSLSNPRSSQVALARFTAEGLLDHSFSSDGKATFFLGSVYDCATSLAQTPSTGDYILAGFAGPRASEQEIAALAKLRGSGN